MPPFLTQTPLPLSFESNNKAAQLSNLPWFGSEVLSRADMLNEICKIVVSTDAKEESLRKIAIKALPLAYPLKEVVNKIIRLDKLPNAFEKVFNARKEVLKLHVEQTSKTTYINYLCNFQYAPKDGQDTVSSRLQPYNSDIQIKFNQLYSAAMEEKLDTDALTRKTLGLEWKGAELFRWGELEWRNKPLWNNQTMLQGLLRCITAFFDNSDKTVSFQENPKFQAYHDAVKETEEETTEVSSFVQNQIVKIRQELETEFVEKLKIHVHALRLHDELLTKVEEMENKKIIESTIFEVVEQIVAGEACITQPLEMESP
jgi:hypothetical protein